MNIAVVLGGGITCDLRLSDPTIRRVKKGIELYNNGEVNLLIVSGAWSFLSNNKKPLKTEAQMMKEYLVGVGIPESAILLEDKSKDTIGNAYFTKEMLMQYERVLKSISVVTSRFHVPRTQYVFNKIFGEKYNITFIGVWSGFKGSKIKEKKITEKQKIKMIKKRVDRLPNGDHKRIRQTIYTNYSMGFRK